MGFNRLKSAARYLSWSQPVWRWKFSIAYCPFCGKSLFVSLAPSPFMTRCMGCKANVTNLSLIPLISKHFGTGMKDAVAYELSTYGKTLDFLKANFCKVQTSEYFPDLKLGEIYNGIMNQDVMQLTFEDSVFDLVTSNQVFEHVPNDLRGFSECRRVLKPGGAFIFTIPLYDIPTTTMIAHVKDGEIEWLAEPDYHDSRLGGPKSSPTYWSHSMNDIVARVENVGFSKVELVNIIIVPTQVEPLKVVYAIK